MESFAKASFWHDLKKAPKEIRQAAISSYKRFRVDPWDERLEFKNLKGSLWSARIVAKNNTSTGWRAMGIRIGDRIYWNFLGDHGAYDARRRALKGNEKG